MATEREVSSTEKLLAVIRKESENTRPQQSATREAGTRQTVTPSVPTGKIMLPRGRDVVGVELIKDGLNIVRMSRAGGAWKAVQTLSASLGSGASLQSPSYIQLLKDSLRKIKGIDKALIWTMVPASRGEIWQLSVPVVKKDLYNAVYWSARKQKNFDHKETFFDYRIMGEITDSGVRKLSAEVFTAPRHEIDLLKKIFSSAGVPLHGITLPSFAMQNIFMAEMFDTGDQPFVVLSIGQQCSSIDIHMEKRLLLSRITRTGLSSIVQALLDERDFTAAISSQDQDLPGKSSAERQAADLDGALRLLALLTNDPAPDGSTDPDHSQDRILQMITDPLDRLSRQVERTINHSVNVQGNPPPLRLYICSSLAASPLVIDHFKKQLGLDVQALDPLDPTLTHAAPAVNSLNNEQRLSFAPASALALSSLEYTPNFLYTSQNKEEKQIRRRNGYLAAAGILILFLITGLFWNYSRQELAEAQLATAQLRERFEAQSLLLTQEDINLLAGEFVQKSTVLRDYTRRFVPVAVLGELSSLTPDNIRLLNVRLDTGPPGSTRQARLVLEGFISGQGISFQSHLSSYVFRLSKSPMFGDTAIQNTETSLFDSQGQVLKFVININVRQVQDEQI